MTDSGDFGHLNDDARARWDANAEWWDARIGDGNDFQEPRGVPVRASPRHSLGEPPGTRDACTPLYGLLRANS